MKISDKEKLFYSYIVVITAMLFLACCNPAKRAAKAFDNDRAAAAKYCAEKFPVKDDTLYLQGGVIIDTIVTVRDSLIQVICPKSDTITTVQQVVKIKTVTIDKLRVDTVTVIRKDSAQISHLTNELSKYKGDATKWKEKAQNRYQFIMWLIVILLMIAILQLIKSKVKLF